MKKPMVKREVAIKAYSRNVGFVGLSASRKAADELSEFGRMSEVGKNQYELYIDHRFDFDEVIEYIKNWSGND